MTDTCSTCHKHFKCTQYCMTNDKLYSTCDCFECFVESHESVDRANVAAMYRSTLIKCFSNQPELLVSVLL
jgi:hypothetical protein